MHLLESIYYLGYLFKKRRDLNNSRKLPAHVISIGNITTGGTGKTPAVISLAEEALRRGFTPVVLTRGYRGSAKGPCFVAKGEGPLLSPEEAGDEPYLMALKTRGAAVIKGPDRYESGVFAMKEIKDTPESRILFMLDDGFQHRKLQRDRDVVLVDSGNPFGNSRLLPVGRLREPLEELGRADIMVLTNSGRDATADSEAEEVIRRFNKTAPVFHAAHKPVSLTDSEGNRKPLEEVSGKTVYGFCGLGNPESFRKTIVETGASLCGFRAFRDHHYYTEADLRELFRSAEASGAGLLVTTSKDLIKIKAGHTPLKILAVDMEFWVDKAFFDEVFRL